MSRFWSPFVHSIEPYVPGEQPKLARLVKLNTNESPYPPSAAVLEAVRSAADDDLRLYPDPDASALKQAIADYHQLDAGQVFVGNGSDEVLAHLFLGFFCQDRPLCFPDITYSFYKVYCGLYGIDYCTVALADDFSLDLSAIPADVGGVIFPNPNAPTGRLLSLDVIREFLASRPDTLVVVDEAYIDFGGESAIALVADHDNLLVTQTLSKSRALAGLRIGLAVGQAPLIDGLNRIKDSFNSYPLDRLAIAAGVASYADEDWFRETCGRVMADREQLAQALGERDFSVLPSAANFLFVRHERVGGAELAAALRGHGVIVRHFSSPPRIADWLRITIGTSSQNAALLAALDDVLS
ncbi:MAG: histidinol-phosphate transaminase [Alcanivoracaceae bacterium]